MSMSQETGMANRLLTRRGAVRAGSLGAAALVGGGALRQAAAQEATPGATVPGSLPSGDGLGVEVLAAFNRLPGTKGIKFWAPADAGRPEWAVSSQADQELVIASAFKGFVLAEFLRQAEAELDPKSGTPLGAQLMQKLAEELDLDEQVFTLGSTDFNPPNLTGKVTAHTVLSSMIQVSDNTAADMALKHVGPQRVRDFIASLGLQHTNIPDSTRQFTAYFFGDPDWQTVTWPQLLELVKDTPYPSRPALNDVITMASSPDDLVAFYARALQGSVFQHAETLETFRSFLMLADVIPMAVPLGISGFMKGGALSGFDHYVLSVAGGIFVAQRWVYFAMILNWEGKDAADPATVQSDFARTAQDIFSLIRERLGAAG